MQYSEQSTPPFNSPYQTHASRADSLLESPYPSPGRHESTSKYPQGLGLYNCHQSIHTNLPPSPSPSESWSNHVSSSASPLMTHAIADPYASGAFEHPIILSPQPWESTQLSPRSSVSPATVMPVYAQAGTDDSYHQISQGLGSVSLEGHGWPQDVRYLQNGSTLPSLRHHPMTVAPERLNSAMLPYETAYNSTQVVRQEPAHATHFEQHNFVGRVNRRRSASQTTRRQSVRSPKQTKSAEPVVYCYQCEKPKGFARHYNYTQHLNTHKANRPRPHVCLHPGCTNSFFRKTDLQRHDKSVHQKLKDMRCKKCPAAFSRKDICSR